MQTTVFETPIEFLKGVGPERAKLLKSELNIFTFGDLVCHYPFRYVDRSRFYKINEVNAELPYAQIIGKIRNISNAGANRQLRLTADFYDETGSIELIWFQGAKWVRKVLTENAEFIVFGKPVYFKGKLNIIHPELNLLKPKTGGQDLHGLENPSSREKPGGIGLTLQPVYSTTEKLSAMGLNSRGIQKLLSSLFEKIQGSIPENLSEDILLKWKLLKRNEALLKIHFPDNARALKMAQSRLKFEELFFIQIEILKIKMSREKGLRGLVFAKVGEMVNRFYKEILPFSLTEAQKRVIKEIRRDLGSGKQMNRLLQGDVGSGKTMVALMCMLIAADNNFQSCLMAPTEILANQHYRNILFLLEKLGLKTALLTGTTKAKERRELHQNLLNGEIKILIGTHALIEEEVKFKNLGLVVIDEQHRFGVEQRAKMQMKRPPDIPDESSEHPPEFRNPNDLAKVVSPPAFQSPPHVLVMTATPIPRTLAMTIYGDLDVSVIDELPPGRKPIKTLHFTDAQRLQLYGMMKKEISMGHQVYVVYPLIFESEKLDYKHLEEGLEALEISFPKPQFQISVVHGKMKQKGRELEMERFLKKETQILVSTTVIEVGVDVPNASVMVIENAERFGLSQLHQLRGRVGRGAEQSYCILCTGDKLGPDGRLRMQTMVQTNDGFKIAETDLQLRGAGDLLGTMQSGEINLRIANLALDGQILQAARKTAEEVLSDDINLAKPANLPVATQFAILQKGKKDWSRIS